MLPRTATFAVTESRGVGSTRYEKSMLQLEDNFDWPNPHYLNFVSTNEFMSQEFLHQSTIKKLVQESY
jgi:hypothetical protein